MGIWLGMLTDCIGFPTGFPRDYNGKTMGMLRKNRKTSMR